MRHALTFIGLALLLTACQPLIPETLRALPQHGTTFSIEVHPYDSSATSPAGLAAMADVLGVKAIRTDYDPAIYSYSWLAFAIADGLKLDLITPYIAVGAPFDPGAYAATCAAGAKLYPGETWEIMNEPNDEAPLNEQQLTPAQYVQLVDAVAPAIRAADPTATIITGGTSGVDLAWLRAIAPAFAVVDGVAVHPYGVAPSGFGAAVATVTLMADRPVYLTEWGEAPQVAADVAAAAQQANGVTPFFNLYELETQPGEQQFGIVGTAAYAAYEAVIR